MNDYERLGLKEGASKDEIQTAYKIRLLRYQQLGENKTTEDEDAFKKIDEAYNRLCGYDVPLEERKHGKLKDFLYYNKEKFAVIALVFVLLLVIIVQSINRPYYDFSVAIIGDFEIESEEYSVDVEGSISSLMQEQIVGIESPIIVTYPRGGDIVQNSAYFSMQQKLIAEMEFGETGIDLMILDTENYQDFKERGYLYTLNDYIVVYEEGNKEIPEELLMQDATGTVYGIRLTDNAFIEKCNFTYTGDLIACIFVNSGRKELAFSGIQAISLQFAPLPVGQEPITDNP